MQTAWIKCVFTVHRLNRMYEVNSMQRWVEKVWSHLLTRNLRASLRASGANKKWDINGTRSCRPRCRNQTASRVPEKINWEVSELVWNRTPDALVSNGSRADVLLLLPVERSNAYERCQNLTRNCRGISKTPLNSWGSNAYAQMSDPLRATAEVYRKTNESIIKSRLRQ